MDISAEGEISRVGKKKSAVVFDNVFLWWLYQCPPRDR